MHKLKKFIINLLDNIYGFFKLLSKEPSVPVMEEIKKRKPIKRKKKTFDPLTCIKPLPKNIEEKAIMSLIEKKTPRKRKSTRTKRKYIRRKK